MFLGAPYPLHGASHTMLFVGIVMMILAIVHPPWILWRAWLLAGLGAAAHVVPSTTSPLSQQPATASDASKRGRTAMAEG